jgi:hypothetical protein
VGSWALLLIMSTSHFKNQVPWSKLGAQPLTLMADKIFLLIVPKYDWSQDEKESQARAVKKARLAFADLIGTGSVPSDDDDDEEGEIGEDGKPMKKSKLIEISAVAQSLLERLMSRFIDSVHVSSDHMLLTFSLYLFLYLYLSLHLFLAASSAHITFNSFFFFIY